MNGVNLQGVLEDGEQVRFLPGGWARVTVGDRVLVTVRGKLVVRPVRARDADRLLVGTSRSGLAWVPTDALVARIGAA